MALESPNCGGRQARGLHADDRHVGQRVGADDLGLELPAVGGLDRDFLGAADDVVVGQDVALVVIDDAAAESAADPLLRGGFVGDLHSRGQLPAEEPAQLLAQVVRDLRPLAAVGLPRRLPRRRARGTARPPGRRGDLATSVTSMCTTLSLTRVGDRMDGAADVRQQAALAVGQGRPAGFFGHGLLGCAALDALLLRLGLRLAVVLAPGRKAAQPAIRWP